MQAVFPGRRRLGPLFGRGDVQKRRVAGMWPCDPGHLTGYPGLRCEMKEDAEWGIRQGFGAVE